MVSGWVKSLLVAGFSVFLCCFFSLAFAQEHGRSVPAHDSLQTPKKPAFDAKEIIFGHVLNNHDFHIIDVVADNGTLHPISIPLPVILYSKKYGWDAFMSSHFHHGEQTYKNYMLLTNDRIAEMKLDPTKYSAQDIVAMDEKGEINPAVKIYDVSLTRNVVQMLISLVLFLWVMLVIAKKYKSGQGVTSAPKGSQSLIEPVITFVRDEVAKPNLGTSYAKYLPFLLTIFFFILINNIIGLIPGSANVTGNIAFTVVLGLLSFVVIIASTDGHYWSHIFNPPGVPLGVKFILVPVEFLSVFIKPFALIIRLFANMVAGHIIIICLISLIFIFGNMSKYAGWGTAPFSIAFTIFIYLIEVLVAFLQAFIFTMLTAVFIGQAIEGKQHKAGDHGQEKPAMLA